MKEKEILLDYFERKERTEKRRNAIKKTYLKKWLEKLLISINTIIFCFVAMTNDFNFMGFLIIMALLIVFVINALIIEKWGRLLKEDNCELEII